MMDIFTEEQLVEMRREPGREDFGKEEFHTMEKVYTFTPALKVPGLYSLMLKVRNIRIKATQQLRSQFQRGHVSWVITADMPTESIIMKVGTTGGSGLEYKMNEQYLDSIVNEWRSRECMKGDESK